MENDKRDLSPYPTVNALPMFKLIIYCRNNNNF